MSQFTRKTRTGRRRPRVGAFSTGPYTSHGVATSLTKTLPDSMDVDLVYRKSFVMNSVGNNTFASRFYTNACYDVDPILGSTSIPGFTEWSNFYSYNRVVAYQVDAAFANGDALPIGLYFVHTNTDPGVSGSNYSPMVSNPHGACTVLGPTSGAGTYRYRSPFITISSVVGTRAPEYEDNYRGTTAANPVDTTYFGIGLNAYSNDFTNGVSVEFSLRLRVRFFDRKILTS